MSSSASTELRGARFRGPPSALTPAKRKASVCLASQLFGLPETPMTLQPLFGTASPGAYSSAVSPELEMAMTTSPAASCPQEPWTASVPWR